MPGKSSIPELYVRSCPGAAPALQPFMLVLAQQGYFSDVHFLAFLSYLQYWKTDGYVTCIQSHMLVRLVH